MKLKLSHILVQHRYQAEDLIKLIAKGQSFAELAVKYSICSSAKEKGYLGNIDPNRLDQDFAEAAKILKPGQTSGIIKTKFGHHLILRHESEASRRSID